MERNEFFLKCFSAETHLNQVLGQGVVLCRGASSFLWTLTACDAWAEYPSELLNSFSFPFWWYLSKLYIKLIRLSNASQLPRVRLNVPYSAAALCLPFPSVYHQANPGSSLSRSCLQQRCSAGGARYRGLPHARARLAHESTTCHTAKGPGKCWVHGAHAAVLWDVGALL